MIEVIKQRLQELGHDNVQIDLTSDFSNGDFTTNVAMRHARQAGKNPRDLAAEIVGQIGDIDGIDRIEVAGPGFINFYASEDYLLDALAGSQSMDLLDRYQGHTVLVEHSSPNLFKPFHIGHTMNNVIGEAIVGLFEKTAAKVVKISYPSDVSLGIGKAVWALLQKGTDQLSGMDSLQDKLDYLGECYVYGTKQFEDSDTVQTEVRDITTQIYESTPGPALEAYKVGRDITLQYFKSITATLGSEFDDLIFESEAGQVGLEIVNDNLDSVFVRSDGAIVYEGEQDGLHTRVFVNSAGYPTYEAKDLGLIDIKFKKHDPDLSIVVTDAEQKQYFKVMLAAAGKIDPDWQDKTVHVTHGRMTLRGQKMSSRLGGVMTAEEVLALLRDRIAETAKSDLDAGDVDKIAVAALKFSILKSSPGSNVDFDPDTSLSFEGDSGPYLQYSIVRINSILAKASDNNMDVELAQGVADEDRVLVRVLARYQHVLNQSLDELAPQVLLHYLVQLAQEFNSYYARNQVVDSDNVEQSQHRLAIITAVRDVLVDGLQTLGIAVPSKM